MDVFETNSDEEEINLHGVQEPVTDYYVSSETGSNSDSEPVTNEYNVNYGDHCTDDNDTDVEDFINQINEEDTNKTTPLYAGCPLSVHEACMRLIRLGYLLNLDKSGMQKLLKEIRNFFPSDCRLPKTTFMLFRMTDNEHRPQVFY